MSASVLPVNIQGWFPLGLTGLISLDPRDFPESLAPQFQSISSLVLSLIYGPTLMYYLGVHYYKGKQFVSLMKAYVMKFLI